MWWGKCWIAARNNSYWLLGEMCYLKPYKIKDIREKKVTMTNGLEAYYDKGIGQIKKGDRVLVYANLIVKKINEK